MAEPEFSAGITVGNKDTYQRSEEVLLSFTLTNNNKDDYYVLTWNTPLEGFYGNFLDVTRDGENVLYKGIMTKRVNPLADDYTFIPAGGKAEATLNLNKGYDVSRPGHYKVTLGPLLLDVQGKMDGVEFQPTKEGKTMVWLSAGPISFVVEG